MKAYHWRNLVAERDRLARLAAGKPDPDSPPVQVNVPVINKPPEPVAATPVAATGAAREYATIGERMKLGASTPGRAICVECAFYAQRNCTNPRAREPVTGVTVEAAIARKNRDSCGPTGRYWILRPAKLRARVVRDDSDPMEYVPPVPVRRLEPFRDAVIVSLWDVAVRESPR